MSMPARRGRWLAIALSVMAIGASSAGAARTPDPERGARLHDMCLPCHGTEVYLPPRRKVTTAAALRKEVERWNRSYNPKLTPDELADIVAWLDQAFYRFGR